MVLEAPRTAHRGTQTHSGLPRTAHPWDTKSAAPRRWNVPRLLTTSSVATREGLLMESTQIPCITWHGHASRYQKRATEELAKVGREPAPWAWITTTCGDDQCLEPSHLRIHAPMRLAYPSDVCIYCGCQATGGDHLLPRYWTGDTKRRFVVTVPSCKTCNAVLNDTLTWSITERRAICHARLRKHFRSTLRTVDHTSAELREFGPVLRKYIVNEIANKREVERMLRFPDDPFYDLRALERSGIENPYVTGLLVAEDDALAEMVRTRT